MKSTEAPDMPSQSRILVLHGPNLNLLGTREPQHYGADTLDTINARLIARCQAAGFACDTLQSNAEYVLIERIHAARTDGTDFILINPAAFTHTSVALRDALAAVTFPSSKFIYPMFTPVNPFAIIPTFPI
jgi:3-dehydroquinate dehydratase-2